MYIYFLQSGELFRGVIMWGNGCLPPPPPPPWVSEIHSFHGGFWAPTDLARL